MSKKLKDTDYLSISTRVRAMENRLLTRERMERMIDARTDEEAAKVLSECGYGDVYKRQDRVSSGERLNQGLDIMVDSFSVLSRASPPECAA